MNFCSSCGEKVRLLIPTGDNRPRFVCESCGVIHYQNPKVVTGCIPEWNDRILLCRRAIEPKSGLWTIPAGFMENQETNMEGAAREAMEEANADMKDMRLFCIYSVPHINQVYTIYRGILREGKASAGEETEKVELVDESNIPWKKIAFPVITETLKIYYEDKLSGRFRIHHGEIRKTQEGEYIAIRLD